MKNYFFIKLLITLHTFYIYIDMPVHYKTKEKIQKLIKEFKDKNFTMPNAKELIESILKYKSPKDRNKAVKIALESIKGSGFSPRKRAKMNKLCKACQLKGGQPEDKEDDSKEEEKDDKGNPIPKKIPEDETFEKLWNRLFKLGKKVQKNVKKLKKAEKIGIQDTQQIKQQAPRIDRIVAQDRSGIIGVRRQVEALNKILQKADPQKLQGEINDLKKKIEEIANKLSSLTNELNKENQEEQNQNQEDQNQK